MTLTRGALGSLFVKIVGAGLIFVVHILLARNMGVHQYGIYTVVVTWLSLLVMGADMGLSTAVVKYTAIYHERAQWGYLRGLLDRAVQVVLGSATVFAICALTIVLMLQDGLDRQIVNTFLIGLATVPLWVLMSIRSAVLQGLHHVVLAQLPDGIIHKLVLGGGAFLFILIANRELSAQIVMFMFLGGLLSAVLVGTWLQSYCLPEGVKHAQAKYKTGAWIKTALPLLFISSSHLVMARTDVVMLGAMTGVDDAAIYTVAARVIGVLSLGVAAVNTIAAPIIVRLHSQNRTGELRRLISFAARGASVFSVVIALVFLSLGNEILSLFGSEFTGGYHALLILVAGQVFSALCGPGGLLLVMTGHEKEAATVLGMAAVINIVLNVILIPAFGVEGAAIATVATLVFWNVVLYTRVRRRLGIDSSVFSSHIANG